ncbi:MAG: hypothetical protein JJ905_09560 [Psychroserpens sp.]|nr:hypothetical protein [Psychroserpens sp.]MBO6632676.1 hypothetical protein [Psychroserpens sp.]MBO6653387.1 hypothetical protein [Psychroserpens sp.]MBO6680586.1 hypothetical protein [Psychroserpens sp.]MBO6750456.1 hypothetical protein [Psychroserpens sp.]
MTAFIQNLPYGRNTNRTNFELVITERRGTCSSKHALLKRVADLNRIPNIELVIGIYKMTELNTPKIGSELSKNALEYIPEAHCYLIIEGKRTDLTSGRANIERIASDIIIEIRIEPDQVSEYKVDYHKAFIRNWLIESNSKLNFDQIWSIREQCIANLTA